jgi:hypothetical protein
MEPADAAGVIVLADEADESKNQVALAGMNFNRSTSSGV